MAEAAPSPQSTRATPRTAARPSWRGAAPPEAPRHRWQQGGQLASGSLVDGRRWWQLRVGLLFTLAGALLALLVWYLLYAPVQTPFVAVVATNYQWPLPPNSWAQEDLQALSDLNAKTLQIADISADWRSSERGLARLAQELKGVAGTQDRSQVVVLYLSLHGAVDGAGTPCLVPPGASPTDSKTWLPLSAILNQLRAAKLPDRTHKLIVLDCSRQIVNWSLGQAGATLIEALPKAVAESNIPNLAILTSSGPGEVAVTTPLLSGSVFGHYLRLGLAGAADHDDSVGNGDGRVSLQELREYLARHVHRWMAHHRGSAAAYGGPQVIPAEADFEVAWSLRTGLLDDMLGTATRNGMDHAEPAVPAAKIIPLWTRLDQLRSLRPWRFDPVAWRNLEHRLLWLEQLASSGKAYEAQAHALLAELTNELNQIEVRRIAATSSPSLPAHAAVVTRDGALPPVKVHSLLLAAFWGTVDQGKLKGLQDRLAQCQADPSARNFASAIAAFEEAGLPSAMEEANLLSLWQRLAVLPSWRDARPLSQVLRAHGAAQEHAAPLADGMLPGDERAHAWVRAQLATLDRTRRDLEDDALLGEARAAGQIAAAETAAESLAAFDLDERASKVFSLRDKVWAELPYLAAWLCRPQPDPKTQEAADGLIRQHLLPLLADAARLERELERSENIAEGADSAWTADSLADAVEKNFAALHDHLKNTIAQLSAANDNSAAMFELESLLTLPFLTWDVRERLAQKRLELRVKLAGSFARPDGAAAKAANAPTAARLHSSRAARWQPHPLATLLKIDAAQPPADAASYDGASGADFIRLAELGEQARVQLAALAKGLSPAAPRFAAAADQPRAGGLKVLCQAESQARRAAALWYEPPGVDPVHALRRADLQQLLLWRAERALDDYYGPARPGGEPLFAIAAGDYLASARVLGLLSEASAARADVLAGLLAKRRIAAQEALAVKASDILLVDQAATVAATVEVQGRSPEALADLPVGTAAVFLSDQVGRIGPASWPLSLPKSQPEAGQPLLAETIALDSAALKGRGPFVQAVATLRGNDFVAPVLLRAPGGVQVDFRPPVYGPPQVTVLGYEQKRASVVFILDCSNSMRQALRVESPDATARSEASRMEVAKGALRALLTDLAERGSLRVGVRLFGHRVGWSTVEADKLLRQTAYAGEIPAELRPYADVEQVLPLGRFDSLAAGKIFDKLRTVQAWGESPLYLALSQAVADFGPDDTAARSIVVITDGQNYQFNPPREFAPSLTDVMSAAERARIAVHIVGFDIPATESAAARREFEQLASRSGGSFVPAASATTLIETLERLLRPGEFRVTAADGTIVGQAELGHPAILSNHRGRRSYEVTFEHLREPVELAGGEAVELAIRRGEPRLEVVPYLKGSPRFEPLVSEDDGSPTQLQAGIHRSVRTQEGVQFPVSLQHKGGHFVARPAEIWVEVTPLGLPPGLDDGSYIFYDAPLSGGVSVPLALLMSRNWPAGAPRAEVRVWAKAAPSTPVAERPLAEVADRLPEGSSGFSIPGVSGVGYQVRTAGGNGQALTIGLIERHDEQSTGVGSLKVTLSPSVDRAVHQFDSRNKLVLHTFTYNRADESLLGRITIQFTTRESAQQHAWRTAQPVIMDVSGRSDVLELTPPSR